MKKITLSLLLLFHLVVYSQTEAGKPQQEEPKAEDASGVSISPSSLRFNLKPGSTLSKEVKITNDSKGSFKFQIGFSDFMMDTNGKPIGIKGSQSKYTLSKWISASPSYFELKPGEVKKIIVTVDIPNSDTANIAAWTIMMIDQIVDRTTPLDPKAQGSTLSMGIQPSFGFGVYIYQNPPNVKLSSVEIQNFKYSDEKGKKVMVMSVKNTGDGIGFCMSYVELTNLTTGKQDKLAVKQYTILPGFYRNFQYPLPETIAKGKYSAVGVMDFGSKTQIETAELEFEIQ